MQRLRFADIIIPAFTAAMAIWVMWNYSLDEKRSREIKEVFKSSFLIVSSNI